MARARARAIFLSADRRRIEAVCDYLTFELNGVEWTLRKLFTHAGRIALARVTFLITLKVAIGWVSPSGGNWHLRLAGSGLPALHTIENPERVLTIQPGENRQVVLSQRRTLHLPDRETIR